MFVPQSRAWIFCNDHTRSTPLDPKLMFWRILYYSGVFGTVWLPYETRCKIGRTSAKFVPRSRIGIFRNESTRSTPLDPKLMFWCVSYHLGAFGTIMWPYETRGKTGRTSTKVASEFFAMNAPDPPHWTLNSCFGAFCTICMHLGSLSCLTKLGAKHFELVQKFVPRSCVESFLNERTRSTPLDPKLIFLCISYYISAAGTVWLPRKTWWQMCRIVVKVRATKSHWNVSQRKHAIHPIGP